MKALEEKPFAIVDIESLGVKPGCIVTEVGIAVYQKGKVIAKDKWVLDAKEGFDAGFTTNQDTLAFHAKRIDPSTSPARLGCFMNQAPYTSIDILAREFGWSNPIPIGSVLDCINHFCASLPPDTVYVGNGIDFDRGLLEPYYDLYCIKPFWGHPRNWADLPTIVLLGELIFGVDVKKSVRAGWPTKHEALDDALQEAEMLDLFIHLLKMEMSQ